MRINEIGADEFLSAMAELGEAIGNIINGEAGKGIKDDLQAFLAIPAAERKAKSVAWAADLLTKYVPVLLKTNVEDVYRILAACDGQTLAEYKECFTVAKMMADMAALKAACGEGGELKGLIAPFLG